MCDACLTSGLVIPYGFCIKSQGSIGSSRKYLQTELAAHLCLAYQLGDI